MALRIKTYEAPHQRVVEPRAEVHQAAVVLVPHIMILATPRYRLLLQRLAERRVVA
jgi:hypothetical protein